MSSKEAAPGERGATRRGRDTVPTQDPANGAGRDIQAGLAELALEAEIAPASVLLGQVADQLPALFDDRGSTAARTTCEQGRRISFARASGRYAAKWLVVLTLFLGFLMIVATAKRQALHDVLAGTLVVMRRQAAAEGPGEPADLFDPDQVRRSQDRVFLISRDRLPANLHPRVAAIRLKILELVPDAERFPTCSRELFVLQRTATDYLPTSIEAYLARPQGYATTNLLPGGKIALKVLEEQLELRSQVLAVRAVKLPERWESSDGLGRRTHWRSFNAWRASNPTRIAGDRP